jgi:hypothetical protein
MQLPENYHEEPLKIVFTSGTFRAADQTVRWECHHRSVKRPVTTL